MIRKALTRTFTNIPISFRSKILKKWYEYLSSLDREGDVMFMNYGFVIPENHLIELEKEDEINRFPIQLYHRVAAAVPIKGKKVLEVGCGRGGGASYIARYLMPNSYIGIDITKQAIEFCQRKYKEISNLQFQLGDAENLPFPANNFDAVVNVESSHCYPNIEKFFAGVHKVLKPGGHFLFVDWRDSNKIQELKDRITSQGFKIIEEEIINSGVIKALELDHERKNNLILKYAPKFLQMPFREFSGTKGTKSFYDSFSNGDRTYLRLVLIRI